MTAPESFIETVRSRLVYPRRHVANARDRLAGRIGAPDPEACMRALAHAERSISELERFVAEAEARNVCTCRCGHVHYLHGGDA